MSRRGAASARARAASEAAARGAGFRNTDGTVTQTHVSDRTDAAKPGPPGTPVGPGPVGSEVTKPNAYSKPESTVSGSTLGPRPTSPTVAYAERSLDLARIRFERAVDRAADERKDYERALAWLVTCRVRDGRCGVCGHKLGDVVPHVCTFPEASASDEVEKERKEAAAAFRARPDAQRPESRDGGGYVRDGKPGETFAEYQARVKAERATAEAVKAGS